jgi:hypothetical protein
MASFEGGNDTPRGVNPGSDDGLVYLEPTASDRIINTHSYKR